jgi:hypothetical protein
MAGFLRVLGTCCLAACLTVIAGCGKPSATTHPGSAGSPRGDASSAKTPDATVITTFTPYTATDELTVPVAEHASGSCWTGSILVSVPGAYRCLVGSQIADPCFAPHHRVAPDTVACVSAPWSSAQVVTLTKALPTVTPRARAMNPWAVLLANGARCVAATGTVQNVGNVSLNLLCPNGTGAGALDTSGPMWHVKYGTPTTGHLSEVAVAAAWKG